MKLIHIFLNTNFKILNKIRKEQNMKPKRYPYRQKLKEPANKQVLSSKNGKLSVLLNQAVIQFQK